MTPLQLRINAHQVHKMDGDELVISTLKDVAIEVALVDVDDQIVGARMPLTAHLIYENGQPVEQLDRHQAVMRGGDAIMVDGFATFKLRVNVLSSLRQHQKFRVLVTGWDEGQGKLEVITQPMRTITKLHRGPREPLPEPVMTPAEVAADLAVVSDAASPVSLKRPRAEEIMSLIDDHDRVIETLRESQQAIMNELRTLSDAAAHQQRQLAAARPPGCG